MPNSIRTQDFFARRRICHQKIHIWAESTAISTSFYLPNRPLASFLRIVLRNSRSPGLLRRPPCHLPAPDALSSRSASFPTQDAPTPCPSPGSLHSYLGRHFSGEVRSMSVHTILLPWLPRQAAKTRLILDPSRYCHQPASASGPFEERAINFTTFIIGQGYRDILESFTYLSNFKLTHHMQPTIPRTIHRTCGSNHDIR